MRRKKVFLFGAGDVGKAAYEILKEEDYYQIVGFLDNNKKKIGTTFCGVEVVSIGVAEKHRDIPIIITSNIFYNEIKKQLDGLGLKNYKYERNIYLSNNLIITEKKFSTIDLWNNEYVGNLYFGISDIIYRKVALEQIDNIILDNDSQPEFIADNLLKLEIHKYDERLTYIAGNGNLKELKKFYPYIMKNGAENFFPLSEMLYLYFMFILKMDKFSCDRVRNEIFKASIKREFAVLGRNTFDYRNKYMLWNEFNYQEEFNNKTIRNIDDIEDSNGSRYYKKYDVNIGIVCDEFLYVLYKDSCNMFYITPDNYKDYVDRLDVFIVASVWNGLNKEWSLKYDKKLDMIRQIVDFYKNNNKRIKTVFYSKEDPIFYEDFIGYAALFDYIFTTDIDCVNRYKSDLKKENVYNINFAVNPLYHNPIGINKYNYDEVIFSGSWYERFQSRNEALTAIFDGIIENGKSICIVDRNFDEKCEIRFPLKYLHFVLKRVSHGKLQKIHKLFNYAININTVQDSETMFANRVYELQAQGNILISNYSKGVARQFENIHIVYDKQDLDGFFQKYKDMDTLIEAQRIGIRNVMTDNTVYDRMEEILHILDISFNKINHNVLIIISQDSEQLQQDIERQIYKNVDVITEKEINDALISKYEFVCFFDAEYMYDIYYIQDMLNGFKYADVDFVTKNNSVYENNYTYTDKFTSKYLTVFSTKNITSFKGMNDTVGITGFCIP